MSHALNHNVHPAIWHFVGSHLEIHYDDISILMYQIIFIDWQRSRCHMPGGSSVDERAIDRKNGHIDLALAQEIDPDLRAGV